MCVCVCRTSRRQSSVAVRAQQQQHTAGEHAVRVLGSQAVTRRQVGAGVLAGLSAVIVGTGPAQAGLFGDPNVKYTEQTSKMIANMKAALEMPTDDPNKEETMKALRQETITWVSAYRRDPKFSGRPSYSNLYTAINALDGQVSSFLD